MRLKLFEHERPGAIGMREAKVSSPTSTFAGRRTSCATAHAFDMIATLLRRIQSSGSGALVSMWIVWSSIADTAAMLPSDVRTADVSPRARSMLNTTSPAVNGAPSWKVTPRRSSNFQFVGSKIFQAVASCGTIARLESMSSRLSYTCMAAARLVSIHCAWGSSVTAPPELLVKRSTFSAAAGPASASAASIIRPANNDLKPLIVTPPWKTQRRVGSIARARKRVRAAGGSFSPYQVRP
jgi:hypothetical protein